MILTFFFVAFLASVIPQLDNFISLVGALSSSALALIFPPLFYSLTWPRAPMLVHIKNATIAIFGVVGGIFGTVMSIKSIVESYWYNYRWIARDTNAVCVHLCMCTLNVHTIDSRVVLTTLQTIQFSLASFYRILQVIYLPYIWEI